jgi:soluble lytic murein transglycosylase-like protein
MRKIMQSWPAKAVLSLILSAAAAHAQAPDAATADPFARLHTELSRAITRHLAEAAAFAPARPAATTAERTPDDSRDASTRRSPLRISLSAVAAAQRRLLALGVDAARVFAEEGLPVELIVVAAAESGFDPLALSPKGARGLWQLMPATAQRFGLRVDRLADERTDPARSTRAAARYLRELFSRFGDWQLALAAYNAGEARIEAALQQHGAKSFGELASRHALPEETIQYVPAILHRGP